LGYRWNVLRVGDANDIERIEDALAIFRETKHRPTLIILDSHIGYGSPHRHDTAAAHGEPLVDVTHPLANKGMALSAIAKLLAVPTKKVAAIGSNDVAMFKRSGVSRIDKRDAYWERNLRYSTVNIRHFSAT
jgi:transketolase